MIDGVPGAAQERSDIGGQGKVKRICGTLLRLYILCKKMRPSCPPGSTPARALVSVGQCWSVLVNLLVNVGPCCCWSTCWSVLVSVGQCWSVLVSVGQCWSVLVSVEWHVSNRSALILLGHCDTTEPLERTPRPLDYYNLYSTSHPLTKT